MFSAEECSAVCSFAGLWVQVQVKDAAVWRRKKHGRQRSLLYRDRILTTAP
jgi:hypothetical protein